LQKWPISSWAVAFSPDGTCLIMPRPGPGPSVCWRDIASGEVVRSLTCPEPIRYLALSTDGDRLAVGTVNGGVVVYDVASGKSLLHWQQDDVLSLTFSRDRNVLACSGYGEPVRLWSGSTGKAPRCFPDSTGDGVSILFSPGGRYVLTGGMDGRIRLWNCSTRQ